MPSFLLQETSLKPYFYVANSFSSFPPAFSFFFHTWGRGNGSAPLGMHPIPRLYGQQEKRPRESSEKRKTLKYPQLGEQPVSSDIKQEPRRAALGTFHHPARQQAE